jgi:hypothetical protein
VERTAAVQAGKSTGPAHNTSVPVTPVSDPWNANTAVNDLGHLPNRQQ